MTLRARRIVMGIALLTMIPAAFMTVNIVQKSIFDNNVSKFIKAELSQSGTQIISNHVDEKNHTLEIVAVGKEITESKQAEANRHKAGYGLTNYQLNIIQGEQSDSILQLHNELRQANTEWNSERKRLAELSTLTNSLQAQLESYTRYEQLTGDMKDEVAALFPQIQAIGLAKVVEAGNDSTARKHYVAAIIQENGKRKLGQAEKEKLRNYLQARTKADSIVICLH